MINHARTLLLNQTADKLACDWEQAVSQEFVPTRLSASLTAVWRAFFGAAPDPWSMNWRAHRYMSLLHASEYRGYLTELDSRISYSVPLDPITTDLPVIVGSPEITDAIRLAGEAIDDVVTGRMLHALQATADGGQMVVQSFGTSETWSSAIVVAADGWTVPVAMGRSGLTLSIAAADVAGYSQAFDVLAPSSHSLVETLSACDALPGEYLLAVFSTASVPEANRALIRSCQALWSNNRAFGLRLVGLLLAFIYQHDAVRSADGQ